MKLRIIFSALVLVLFSWSVLAEETPLDTTTPPTEIPTTPAQYSGPPTIKFYLSDEDYLLVQVAGLRFSEVQGFMFAGRDISSTIHQFESNGTIKFEETDDGFQMNVNVPIQQLAGRNEFSVIYAGDNRLSATIDSEKLLQDKSTGNDRGFGYTRVYGSITERNYCGYCGSTVYSSYASIAIYTWNGSWSYRGSTTATSYGYFDVSLQGYNASKMLIVATSRSGKSRSMVVYGPSCSCSNTSVNAGMYLY